jgi:hypothetical protein
VGAVSTVVPMSQFGSTADALEAARRALAARDADLSEADRALAEAIHGAYTIAVDSINRIDAINAEVDAAATDHPKDTAAGAREIGHHLLAKNREIAAVIIEAQAAAEAKTIALKGLTERYRPSTAG